MPLSTQMPLSTTVILLPSLKIVSDKILKLQSFRPSLCLDFPSSNLALTRGFVYKKQSVFQKHRVWGRCGMTELTKISSVSCGNGDEGFRTLETESLFDGSSEFQPQIAAGGLEAKLNKMSKWLGVAIFAAIVLLRHDAEALWIVMGSNINAMLSVTLKRILNQERPIGTLRPDPGMPSSHAQSIFFIVVFGSISAVEWLGVNAASMVICGLSFILGSYLSWLRVSQKLHTLSQVLVGGIVGSSFSILWYWYWKAAVREAYSSSLWVQLAVIFGAFLFVLGFCVYVVKNWFNDERSV